MAGEASNFLALLFPVMVVMLWLAILKFMASRGWAKYARRQASDARLPLDAVKFRFSSVFIRDPLGPADSRRGFKSYKTTVNVYVAPSGLFMRPILIVRPFHALLHFRWSEIESISWETSNVFLNVKWSESRLEFGRGLPPMYIAHAVGRKVYEAWCTHTRRPI